MSYSIYIGEAEIDADWDDLYVRFIARHEELEEVPDFFVDNTTKRDTRGFGWCDISGKTNGRHPGYSQMRDFSQLTGLEDLFYKELIVTHPGCVRLTQDHLDQVNTAVEEYYDENPGSVPGWEEGQYTTLCKLLWYQWWMEWALKNCKVPCVSNS
jgi:hypothetical protein